MDSLCALNNNEKSCLPSENIFIISKITDTKPITGNNMLIKKIAKKLNCSVKDNDQENELCIIDKIKNGNYNNDVKKEIEQQELIYFKPKTVRLDKDYWINNTEIDNIQFQLQQAFPGYYYSFIHMIDLIPFESANKDKIENGNKIYPITDINFVDEVKGNGVLNFNDKLRKYGFIINTDTSRGSGIHWFSIFMNFETKPFTIEYFNSSGQPLIYGEHKKHREKFYKFLINIVDELNKAGYPSEYIHVSGIEHQRHDTANCGSYSLYYIWSRLNKVPISYFKKNKILDENMEKFRSFLFRI